MSFSSVKKSLGGSLGGWTGGLGMLVADPRTENVWVIRGAKENTMTPLTL